jgi:hypothetical protein
LIATFRLDLPILLSYMILYDSSLLLNLRAEEYAAVWCRRAIQTRLPQYRAMSLHVSVFVSASAFGPVFLQDFAAALVNFAARYAPGAALAIAEALSWLGEARLSSDSEASVQYFRNPV